MKLLFVLSEYLPDSGGGIISYYSGVLPQLVRAGHEVDVLVAQANSYDRPGLTIDGVRVSYLRGALVREATTGFDRYRINHPTLRAFLPVAWAAFEQAAHGKGYDLVETTDFPLLFAPWVVATDAPPVNISMHGSSGQLEWNDPPFDRTVDADMVRMIEQSAFSHAQALQTNSEVNAKFWTSLTHRAIQILPPAFTETQRIMEPSHRGPHGLVAGRLQCWKGPRILCRALEDVPGAVVRWIGRDVSDDDGKLMSEKLGEEYPDLFGKRFLHQDGVPYEQVLAEIAGAAFLCVPSTWDVFNLTVVEAMSLGTPVICSTKAGASMLIRHGENGFLFDPEKPEELVACLNQVRSLSEMERSRMAQNAVATIEKWMDPQLLARERIDYYTRVMTNWKRQPPQEWLRAVLSARSDATARLSVLRLFKIRELLWATSQQLVAGVKRTIRRCKSDFTP